MNDLDKLTKLAMELQSLAQIGLTYTKIFMIRKDLKESERFRQNLWP